MRDVDIATLIEHCKQFQTLPNLLKEDLNLLFSSRDSHSQTSPVDTLVLFVLEYFSGRSKPSDSSNALPGALQLIEEVLASYSKCLDAVDSARLTALKGHLLQNLAYLDPRAVDWYLVERAIECFKKASQFLSNCGPESALKRHFSWRAANLCVELQNELEASNLLHDALCGPVRWATPGLYFDCASRLLRLRREYIAKALEGTWEYLADAWAYLPAQVQSNPGKQAIGNPQPEKARDILTSPLAEILKAAGFSSSQKIASSGPSTSVILADFEWSPDDRLGLCCLLYLNKQGTLQGNTYIDEALRLLRFVNTSNVHVEHIRKYLESVEPIDACAQQAAPDACSKEFDLKEDLTKGDLHSVLKKAEALLSDPNISADPVIYARVRRYATTAIGRIESPERAVSSLKEALDRLSSRDDPAAIKERAKIHSVIGFTLWNLLQDDEAILEFESALACYAKLTDQQGVVNATNKRARILSEIGDYGQVNEANALIATFASLWGKSEWLNLMQGKDKLEYSGYFNTPQESTIATLRQALFEAEKLSEKIVPLGKQLRALGHCEDIVTLAGAWCHYIGKSPIGSLTDTDRKFLLELLKKLGAVRGLRYQLKLAMLLSSKDNDETCRRDFYAVTLRLLQNRIKNSRLLSTQKRLIEQYVTALSLLISTTPPEDTREFLLQLHHIKLSSPDEDKYIQQEKSEREDKKNKTILTTPTTNEVHKKTEGWMVSKPDEQESFRVGDLNVSALLERLNHQKAALVEYFLGTDKGSDAAVVLYQNQIRYFPLRMRDSLEQLKRRAGSLERRRMSTESAAFEVFKKAFGRNTDSSTSAGFMQILRELGSACLPAPMQECLASAELIYLAPHRRLHGIPLHALPIGDHLPLILTTNVLYIPKASYILQSNVGNITKFPFPYLCINTDDAEIYGESFIQLFGDCEYKNRWSDDVSASQRLKDMALHKQAWFYCHSYRDKDDPRCVHLALPKGVRLFTHLINASNTRFENTDIFLFACSSGRPNLLGSQEQLSLASSFLRKGASAVVSSLWDPSVTCGSADDPNFTFAFASELLKALQTKSKAPAFREAFQAAVSTQWQNPYVWLRCACFIIHGIDSRES